LGGLKDKDSLKPYKVVHFQPFDPVHKRTEAVVKTKDGVGVNRIRIKQKD
jgi:H+-transporting ATPase